MSKPCWQRILALSACLLLLIPQIAVAADGPSKETWRILLINWFPMFLLIAIWIYFLRKRSEQPWNSEKLNQHLEKIGQSLERIARALEKK